VNHSHRDARNQVFLRNPDLKFKDNDISDGEIIDIYLRGDVFNSDLEEERLYFGFDNDLYVEGTTRDDMMYEQTKRAADNFLQYYLFHHCKL
jgi:hypothetical protein